jgi:tryptophan halogenase
MKETVSDQRIRNVVILGGGTAGWMSAAYLGKAFHGTVSVTVLEAPAVPRIGVGEATIPNLQTAFFDFLGVPEEEWMRECGASFKMAVKFINWRTPGTGTPDARRLNGADDHFYHIFGQLPVHDEIPLSHYWVNRRYTTGNHDAFDYTCYKEPPVMDAKLAPRWLDGTRATNYAWHFDAQRVADYLCRFATTKLGVRHVSDSMTEVLRDERGYISGLRTKSGEVLTGDLFVDCSGFRSLLMNEAMGEPFINMNDYLLCDRAVATAVPCDGAVHGVEPYTSSIAMTSGWTWKIPMAKRFGTGYVYSSQFSTQDEATEEFCRLWNLDPDKATLNQIRFRVGRNRRAWVKNCVGIGLSSCFVEPLESTGIYFIYAALYQLVKHFPDRSFDQILIDRFNREVETMFDDTRDFIQAHYYFSPRTDTPFWRANKELHLADQITEKVAMYRAGMAINLPTADDDERYYHNFEEEFRNFWSNSNYFCIFAGLGLMPDHPAPLLAHRPESVHSAEEIFEQVRERQRDLVQTLPTTYEFLCQRQLHGL